MGGEGDDDARWSCAAAARGGADIIFRRRPRRRRFRQMQICVVTPTRRTGHSEARAPMRASAPAVIAPLAPLTPLARARRRRAGAPRAMGRVLPSVVVEPTLLASSPEAPARDTLVFLHGWPDSPALWDSQTNALAREGYRCVSIPLPGYPPDDARAGATAAGRMNLNFDAAVEDVASTMRATTTPPATVIAHDWGCVVTYRLQRKHPELVRRVAVLDVGNDVDGLTRRERAWIVAYQAWLIAAHQAGGAVGDWMTTTFARAAGAPGVGGRGEGGRRTVSAALNWPYAAFWRERLRGGGGGGEDEEKTSADERRIGDASSRRVPSCATLYMYGTDKPARFHGDRWLKDVRENPAGGKVVAVEGAGHWFLVTHASATNEALSTWLRETEDAPPPRSRSAL